jgi:hypothetical protein
MMHAVTLWNPWAAAVAMGWKSVETRTKRTLLRGEFAIHSAKQWDRAQRKAARRLALRIGKPEDFFVETKDCPANQRGVVVGVGRLVRCEVMTEELIAQQSEIELAFGGWVPGRWAWFLEDMIPLHEPVPLRGRQWVWTLSRSDERKIRDQLKKQERP